MGKWVFTLRGLTLGWQAGLTGKTSKSKGGSGFLIGLASLPACSLFLIRDFLISWVPSFHVFQRRDCWLKKIVVPQLLNIFWQFCCWWQNHTASSSVLHGNQGMPRWVMGNMKRCLLIWSTLAFAHVNTQIDKNINGHYLCIRHKIFLWNFHECKNSISDGCSTVVL